MSTPNVFFRTADIEAREVEEFCHGGIGEQPLEVRRARLACRDLHKIGGAVTRRKLHDTEPVAPGIEAERLRVDGDRGAGCIVVRQIAFVQSDGHRVGMACRDRQRQQSGLLASHSIV